MIKAFVHNWGGYSMVIDGEFIPTEGLVIEFHDHYCLREYIGNLYYSYDYDIMIRKTKLGVDICIDTERDAFGTV